MINILIFLGLIFFAGLLVFAWPNYTIKDFCKALFSRQVLVALLTSLVLISGYIYTSNKQQDLETFKTKASAYTTFLNALVISGERNSLVQLNQALLNLYIYAPDCVIRE